MLLNELNELHKASLSLCVDCYVGALFAHDAHNGSTDVVDHCNDEKSYYLLLETVVFTCESLFDKLNVLFQL